MLFRQLNLSFIQIFLRRVCILVVFSVAALPAFLSTASGATIRVEDGRDCEISLNGKIVKGDYQRLEKTRKNIIQETKYPSGPLRLCLNSNGGSLGEAAKLAVLVRSGMMATRIQANKVCLSACAWIFMMGRTNQFWDGSGEYQFDDRAMSSNAKLGFHAPELPLGASETIPTSVAKRSHDVLLEAFAEILKISFDPEGNNRVKMDLLHAAMSTPPSGFFYIDTVDKVGRWDIPIFDAKVPTTINEIGATNACLNASSWSHTTRSKLTGYRAIGANKVESIAYTAASDEYEIVIFSGYIGAGCTVSAKAIPPSEYGGESYNEVKLKSCIDGVYGARCSYNILSVFPPDTPLSSLAGVKGKRLVRQLSAESKPATGQRKQCTLGTRNARVVNVNEFVNIRSSSSLNSRIVARANKNERLTLLEPNKWWYQGTALGKQCSIFCDQLHQTPNNRYLQSQAQKCIKDTQIWQKIKNSRGQTGYVSVYFLEGQR